MAVGVVVAPARRQAYESGESRPMRRPLAIGIGRHALSQRWSRVVSPLSPRAAIMTRRRTALPHGTGAQRARDGQGQERIRQERIRYGDHRPGAAAKRSDQGLAKGPPPGGAKRFALHLQRHLHLYRCEAKVAIVDPGPDDDLHLAALLAAVDGAEVEAISSPTPIAITSAD